MVNLTLNSIFPSIVVGQTFCICLFIHKCYMIQVSYIAFYCICCIGSPTFECQPLNDGLGGMSQPHFWKSVRMTLTFSKWVLGIPLGLLTLHSSIAGLKTPRLEAISLESYRIVDVENGLAWAIWTSATQVMAKRKVESQTSNLTPDH
jgi:hypothetical protein